MSLSKPLLLVVVIRRSLFIQFESEKQQQTHKKTNKQTQTKQQQTLRLKDALTDGLKRIRHG
jgi:hypothetical protein